tara:strand:+ start:14656 stop:15420 length:765 start_codon:yes stop_codon:yes gene_type:complete
MKTIELKGNGQIREEERRTLMDVPHLDETLTFVLPLAGPNYQSEVMKTLHYSGLSRPTAAQTISLLDIALQNPDEINCAEIAEGFKYRIWTATESLVLPFPEGKIVYDNSGDMFVPPLPVHGWKRRLLTELIEKNDPRVRFVPNRDGRRISYHDSIKTLLRDPYVIAEIGEKMLPILERVAKKVHKGRSGAWLRGTNNIDIEEGTNMCTSISLDEGGIHLVSSPGLGYLNGAGAPIPMQDDGRRGYASGIIKPK